jgi:transcriptional regulator GlxA family with amidase domain
MRVLIFILDGAQLLDVAGPAQVVDTARLLGAPYDLHFVGAARNRTTKMGLTLAGIEPLPPPHPDDWIIVSGFSAYDPEVRRVVIRQPFASEQELAWLQRAYQIGARISSVCSGAFALGEAGILDHRRATCHWLAIEELRKRFPLTKVVDNALFVDDGLVITSAGASAGIDMALHLVERDHGGRMAADITRGLVLYQRRSSADAQLSAYSCHRAHLHPGVHRAQDWMSRHVEEPATLEQLAKIARMSVRSLTREFRAVTGLSVVSYREKLKVEQARRLAADTDLSMEEVAFRCGFGGARQLRRVWRKHQNEPIRRRPVKERRSTA